MNFTYCCDVKDHTESPFGPEATNRDDSDQSTERTGAGQCKARVAHPLLML